MHRNRNELQKATSMADVVKHIDRRTRKALRGKTYSDDNFTFAKEQVRMHIELLIDETDTPFLDDTVFDPFMKQMLPAMIDQAFDVAVRKHSTWHLSGCAPWRNKHNW